MRSLTLLLPAILAATSVHAKTDLRGCISSATVNQWDQASMIWYVPETGEICDFPDCGGGRAPPKYDTPGCPLYTGTATLTPSYLPGYGPGATATAKTVAETASATADVTSSSSSSKNTDKAESSGSKTDMTITSAASTATGTGASGPSTLESSVRSNQASASASNDSVSATGDAASPTQTDNAASSMGYNTYGGMIVAAGLAILAL